MAGYVLLDRFAPVLVSRRVGPMNAESMTSLRNDVNARMRASNEKIALVYDALPSAAGPPDAAARKVVADWWREDRELLVRRCASIEFSLPSAVSRGVLTAILWIATPPIPTGVHSDSRTAVEAAIERAGRRGKIEPLSVLKALDALSTSARAS
ncbi:hypothetical protein [Sandaracinus amylolyticus]|uniref:hypothetical protein n=1 Tax=Sandaracinus amylolyticus TaxID=927083 RepID=UPI001F235CCD|nr:hypothetical protein [Sandaracinus amylolyticus]UJR86279.1 Hypothetical protein I5071_83630 [Sandaracinus amylolyticus]